MAFRGITRGVARGVSYAATGALDGFGKTLYIEGDSWMLDDTSERRIPPGMNLGIYTTTNSAVGGSTLVNPNPSSGNGKNIKDRMVADLGGVSYSKVLFNGGINDVYDYTGGPGSYAVTAAEMKTALVLALDAALSVSPDVTYVGIAPLGAWGGFVDLTYGPIVGDFRTWAEAYCAAIGVKYVDSYGLLTDGLGDGYGTDGIHADYVDASAVHLDAGGVDYFAPFVEAALSASVPTVTNAVIVTRNRPNRDLLSLTDMTNIAAFIDGVGDEWSPVSGKYDTWLLNQSDQTNALEGLGGTAAVKVGTVTQVAGGMLFGATGSYLKLAVDMQQFDTEGSFSVGHLITAAETSGAGNLNLWGGQANQGAVISALNCQYRNTANDLRFYAMTSGAAVTLSIATLATLDNTGVHMRATLPAIIDIENATVTAEAGIESGTGATNYWDLPMVNPDFVVNGQQTLTGTYTAHKDNTWGVFYIADENATPATWVAAAEAAS